MKKHFLKSFALLAMLFSALTLSAQSGVDWETIGWIGSTDANYNNKFKCSTTEGLVNIQHPGFASEIGIYMTFPAAGIDCNLTGISVQGAGIIMHLSSFTAKETEVVVNYAGGSRTFWVYYADGAEGGSDEGGEELPDTEAPTLISVELFGAAQNFVLLSPNATDNKGVTSYLITPNGGAEKEVTLDNAGKIKIEGLTLDKSYTYSVKAKDAAGNVSAAKEITFSTLDRIFCEEEILPNVQFTTNQKLTFTAKKVSNTETLFTLTSSTSTLTKMFNVNLTNAGSGVLPAGYVWKDDWTLTDNTLSKTVTWETYPTNPITIAITANRTPGAGESNLIGLSYSMDISNTCGEEPDPTPEPEPEVVESNYCQKLLTNGDKEIYVTAIKTAENVYQLIVEGEKVSQITGTHYNPGGIHIGGLTPKEKTTGDYGNKVVYEFELESAPTIYNPLYVLFEGSGDLNFGNINDIVWGTCPEKETSILTSLNATAANTLCKVNESVAITVVAKDQYGANMNAGTVEYTISPADAGTIVDNVFTPTKAGLVTITASVGTVQAEPVEVYAYAGDNLALSTNIVTDNKIIAQSDVNPTIGATNAFYAVDGNDSQWQGSYTNGTADNDVARTYDAWFVVDLGAYYDLDLVSIHFEGACSQAYTIAVSKDFVNWVTAYTYNGSAGVQQNRIDALYGTNLQNATDIRFVRFWSTKAATGYGMKIYDMQVYGSNRQEVTKTATKPVINSATVTSKTIEQAILSINTTSSVAIAKYRVVDNANGIDWFVSSLNPTEYVIAHLKDNTSYTLSLYAYDIDGNISDVFTMEEFKTLADNTKPTTASPTPTRDEEDVLAFYSDTYTPVINWGSKKDWNGAGTVTENAISANNYLMYKDVTWWGWTYGVKDGYTNGTLTGVDCSNMEYLHIDVWGPIDGKIRVIPIYGGGVPNNENYYAEVTIKAGQWNSVDVALADFVGAGDKHDFSSIYQIKFAELNIETVSIDNVYFWKSAGTAPVESVTLDKTTATIEVDEALQLKATVLPAEAANKNVVWTSSNTSVATVSAEGIVTGLTVGTTTITATSEDDNTKATCAITVEPITVKTWWGGPVTLTLAGQEHYVLYSFTRNENKTITYTAIFDQGNIDVVKQVSLSDGWHELQWADAGNTTVSWTSTSTHNAGEKILGFFYFGGPRIDFNTEAIAYIVGSSNERPILSVESVTLDKTSCELMPTETAQLIATVNPGYVANKNVTWTSSNTAVATVDANGLVTAVAAGSATITATSVADNTKTATCTVNVMAELTDATYYANAFFIENGRFVGFNYSITRTAERKLHYEATVNGNVVGLVVEINDGNWHGMVYDADSKSYSYTTDNTYADGITTINHFFYVKFAGGAQEVDADYTVGSTNSPVRTMVGINDQEADQTTRLAQYTSPVDVVVARSFSPDYWQTITLPFTLNAAQITEIFGAGTQVLKLAKAGVAPDQAMELGFTTVTGIQASTPYLIMPAQTVGAGTIVRNVTLNTNAQTVKVSNVTMHPLLDKVTYDYTTDDVLFFVGSDNYLHYKANNNEILGLRAYFTFDGITTYAQAANVRARIALREDAATGLDNLINENAPVKVIENGQLIIIRDGVKYNIQGQKL
ncbi:MAG: Ig-like domain-containing protein [Paludibacteraceae bacterium]|nr:Ig-like domain-containing protein [Paludibacteraceae bacterium]